MLSFRSFALLALVGFTSAIPVDPSVVTGVLGNVLGGGLPSLPGVPAAPGLPGLPRSVDTSLLNGVTSGAPAVPGLPSQVDPSIIGGLAGGAVLPGAPSLPGLRRQVDTSIIDDLLAAVSGGVPKTRRDTGGVEDIVGGLTNNVALPVAPGALPGAPVALPDAPVALPGSPIAAPLPRAEPRSAVVIIQSTVDKVQPVVDAITAAVSVKADIQVDLVIERLGAIVVILQDTIDEVKVIIVNPVGFVTSIEELAAVLSILIIVIAKVLFLVSTVPVLATAAVATLIATIGGLLATLLSLILPIAAGVLAILIPTLYGVVSFLYILNLKGLVAILGLPDLF